MTLTRTQLIVAIIGMLLLGGLGKAGYDVSRHLAQDHLQHHFLIVVTNELIRRDPSLATLVNALLDTPGSAVEATDDASSAPPLPTDETDETDPST
jgi:nucleoside-diphosphate-sugar epimerase